MHFLNLLSEFGVLSTQLSVVLLPVLLVAAPLSVHVINVFVELVSSSLVLFKSSPVVDYILLSIILVDQLIVALNQVSLSIFLSKQSILE